jgi:hypothetical protein
LELLLPKEVCVVRWALVTVLAIHGLIHFLGSVKAFGLRDLAELTLPVSRGMGLVWLFAGGMLLAAAWLLSRSAPSWWIVALVGVVVSQLAIFTSWQDAKYGTVANGVLLLGAVWGVLSVGPPSFRAQRVREAAELSAEIQPARPLTEEELHHLPPAVARYLRLSGAVGRPPVEAFRASFRGRIRADGNQPWMSFTAEQDTFLNPPTRLFHITASKAGIPVDVYHRFQDGVARFEVRLASLVPLVRAEGPEMNQSETVTFFNDLCLLAPSALARAEIEWEDFGSQRVRAHYSLSRERVTADLLFDETGWLVDFVSDDRFRASADGATFQQVRWSTPVQGHQDWDGYRIFSRGEGVWHGEDGALPYVELSVIDFRPREPPKSAAGERVVGLEAVAR